MRKLNRRGFLKAIGALTATAIVAPKALLSKEEFVEKAVPEIIKSNGGFYIENTYIGNVIGFTQEFYRPLMDVSSVYDSGRRSFVSGPVEATIHAKIEASPVSLSRIEDTLVCASKTNFAIVSGSMKFVFSAYITDLETHIERRLSYHNIRFEITGGVSIEEA